MDRPKAIENPDNICFKCLNETPKMSLHNIEIPELGYGSGFDGWSTEIHLCDECIKETNPEWWKLEIIAEDYCEEYKYEDEIFGYIKTLPLESQELFYNRFIDGWNSGYRMESQDWIDYELDLLPHEKCKEYGMYSPEERKAYQDRFPMCDKVKIVVYDDSSKGSRCPFGAFGNKDGTADGHQTQDECYKCTNFKIREGEIMTVDLKEEEIKRTKHQIEELTKRLKELAE